MRVLFINHPEADYGEYFLYNGLCEVLGPENVIDYPSKLSYHGEVHIYPRPWHHGEIGLTAPFGFAKPQPQQPCDLDQHFDFVVVGSPRPQAVETAQQLLPRLKTDKIVLHDGEDYFEFAHSAIKKTKARLYLKRELVKMEPVDNVTVKPFPFSCPLTISQNCTKEVDVLCAVGDSHPARAASKQAVANIPGLRVLAGHWGWSRYIELIALSRIAVAPRGHGEDTVRRWEIPAFDTLLMCEKLSLLEENPLRDGEHCVYYEGTDDLARKITWWCEHEEERARVAAAGQKFVQEHHSNAARARQLIEWVKSL